MKFTIPAGTVVKSGAPLNPLPNDLVENIAQLVSRSSEIIEAHLPVCLIEGMMKVPAFILFLGVGDVSRSAGLMENIENALTSILPTGPHLDVWPLSMADPILHGIRKANCIIFERRAERSSC
jgi:hypothetical protein